MPLRSETFCTIPLSMILSTTFPTGASLRRALAGLASICLVALTTPATAADFDGDYVEDGIDNCWQQPNPSQRNSDRDAYGDACDPDLDQNGLVEPADRALFEARFYTTDPVADFDEDGRVDFADLGRLRAAYRGTPGPGAAPVDRDGDGLLDADDLCPESRGASRSLARGCGLADLTHRSREILTNAPDRAMRSLRTPEFDDAGFVDAFDAVEGLADLLAQVDTAMASGDACQAASAAELARDGMRTQAATLDRMIATGIDEIWTTTPGPSGVPGVDFDEFHGYDEAFEPYEVLRRNVAATLASIEAATRDVEAACNEIAGPTTTTGILASYDAATGIVELQDGRTIPFVPDHARASGAAPLVDGSQVEIGGYQLADASILGLDITIVAPGAYIPLPILPCTTFQVVPNQPYKMSPSAARHDARGYLTGGILRLETGMQFAFDQSNCPTSWGNGWLAHTAQIDFIGTGHSVQMTGGSTPIPVYAPNGFWNSYQVRVRTYMSHCGPLSPGSAAVVCSDPDVRSDETYAVTLRVMGEYCDLEYDRDEFLLDAPGASAYNGAVLSGFSLNWSSPAVGNPTAHATAIGWGMHNDISSYPNTETIDQYEGFAVYPWDFGDGWNGSKTDNQLLVLHGTTDRAGLIWPAVVGTNAGHPFRYSCRLPEIVRDGISTCANVEPNTFHTAPLASAYISQAPNGNFSHQNTQAWDMPASTGTNLYAARGGVVTYVYEASNENCTTRQQCEDNEIVANAIRILHEDGTQMSYLHLRLNGAFVEEGERVVRGQLIGETGNTGFSTGPHLHLQHNVPTWSGWGFGNASFHALEFELLPPTITERFCWEFDDDQIIFQVQ